ncbi:MAG: hypothetical protein HOM94_01705 [Candidatus Marinimicrobia bacterium]|nr:hypothetical protein [Candidatus Neomarinimicrobiota bacterium]
MRKITGIKKAWVNGLDVFIEHDAGVVLLTREAKPTLAIFGIIKMMAGDESYFGYDNDVLTACYCSSGDGEFFNTEEDGEKWVSDEFIEWKKVSQAEMVEIYEEEKGLKTVEEVTEYLIKRITE